MRPLYLWVPVLALVLPVGGCDEEPTDAELVCAERPNCDKDYCEQVLIPGVDFTMGSEEPPRTNSSWPSGDERPPHAVRVDPFCMDQYEVTIERYENCVDAGVCDPAGLNWDDGSRAYQTVVNHLPDNCYDDLRDCKYWPVNGKNYWQAKNYCEWVGGRLCTEAEWERAAHGPGYEPRTHPWGNDDPTYDLVNIPSTGPGVTEPVDTHEAGRSVEGIYNMAGNVYEWVYDAYESYEEADQDDPQINPVVEPSSGGDTYIGRGSCFFTEPLRTVTERTMWPGAFDWG